MILRRTQPNAAEASAYPFGPVIPILSVLFCILLMTRLPIRTMGALLRLADYRSLRLLLLQPQAQQFTTKNEADTALALHTYRFVILSAA